MFTDLAGLEETNGTLSPHEGRNLMIEDRKLRPNSLLHVRLSKKVVCSAFQDPRHKPSTQSQAPPTPQHRSTDPS